MAQNVTNADCFEKNKKIYVTYSLDKEADIRLMVSINGSDFNPVNTTFLSGDIGLNVKAGNNKTIVWDVLRDQGPLIGDVQFQVVATESFNSYKKRIKSTKHQNAKKQSQSLYSNTCDEFYSKAGTADISIFEIGVGASLKSKIGFPLTGSVITLRYKMIEIVPASFTYDFKSITARGLSKSGFYWKPQVRLLFPINQYLAIAPSIGSSLDIFESDWWFVTTIHLRYLFYSGASYLDFYVGYEDRGFAFGVSYSLAYPFYKK